MHGFDQPMKKPACPILKVQQVPDGKPHQIASTTAVMLTALIMELMPIAIEHMPNSVGRCSFRLFGRTCPSAEPITPPASTEIQLTITPIGIGFPSFAFPFSSVFYFTVEKRLWQAKENRTAEAVRFRKVLLTLRSRRSA